MSDDGEVLPYPLTQELKQQLDDLPREAEQVESAKKGLEDQRTSAENAAEEK